MFSRIWIFSCFGLLDLWGFTGLFLDLSFGGLWAKWLVRPYSLARILDEDLPPKARFWLAFMTATAFVPLGGVFVPVWIYLRHRVVPWSND